MRSEKEEIEAALEKANQTKKLWLSLIFLAAGAPGVLNSLHIISYVFYTIHSDYQCYVPELSEAGWTMEQIQNVSVPTRETSQISHCNYYNWNYSDFSRRSPDEVFSLVNKMPKPDIIECKERVFEEYNSAVSEWDLVCNRIFLRSHIQSTFATGKLVGALTFGFVSDRLGRKLSFTLASLLYIVASFLILLFRSYYFFLFFRFIIGIAGAATYVTGYTLFSEIVVGMKKVWLSSIFQVPFAIGLLVISAVAYYVHDWRSLQMIISLVAALLPICCWFFPESPLWLLSQGRGKDARKLLSKIGVPISDSEVVSVTNPGKPKKDEDTAWYIKLMSSMEKFTLMFSTKVLLHRTLTCCLMWFSLGLSYFGLALNAENFGVDIYLYIAGNGLIEMIGYFVPIPLMTIAGRKKLSVILYFLTGVCLLSILLISQDNKLLILSAAILSRSLAGTTYTIVTLYTSELFPTTVRNTAIGSSMASCYVGMISAPYIIDILGVYKWYIPSTLIGVFCLVASLVAISLPETKGKKLCSTVEEIDDLSE